jgi:hypothetical protein
MIGQGRGVEEDMSGGMKNDEVRRTAVDRVNECGESTALLYHRTASPVRGSVLLGCSEAASLLECCEAASLHSIILRGCDHL